MCIHVYACVSASLSLMNKENLFFFFLKILFMYSRVTQTEREAETQAEGEAGSINGVRLGPVSRVTPWIEGGAKPLRHPGCPRNKMFKKYK